LASSPGQMYWRGNSFDMSMTHLSEGGQDARSHLAVQRARACLARRPSRPSLRVSQQN
jgi:hypothetical protein